ncbi:hypothetical protein [Corynebacterium mustelae]|nr:hypothetical protein [Corynebacterium mustelae]
MCLKQQYIRGTWLFDANRCHVVTLSSIEVRSYAAPGFPQRQDTHEPRVVLAASTSNALYLIPASHCLQELSPTQMTVPSECRPRVYAAPAATAAQLAVHLRVRRHPLTLNPTRPIPFPDDDSDYHTGNKSSWVQIPILVARLVVGLHDPPGISALNASHN